MSDDDQDPPERDAFKILIATDCHLGYEEKSIRGEDSFTTFEEILKYGKRHEVDFVLLGGDLFHENKPTQSTVMKCINLLRKYCLGPRPNKFQFLTDPELIFKHCLNKTVNFEDPNLNVEMPVFSIHGNHDDPSGAGQIGSLDLMSVTGLLNYFGKWTNLNKVTVAPLILKKGSTHIALYGLSYIKDQRLSRLFRDGEVKMLRPSEIDSCFNIFVLHQNRAKHSDHSFIPENILPSFFDFILWGHEHECRIDPEPAMDKDFRICQPGSPVATSLSEGEAVPKHVGILHVHNCRFKLQKLKLKTVRPFVFDSINVHDNDEIKKKPLKPLAESIEAYVDRYIEHRMIPKAAEQLTGHPKQPKLPLLRLRIFYTDDEEKIDLFRLDQKYLDQVANSTDIILLRKQRVAVKKEGMYNVDDDDNVQMENALGYDEDAPEWSKTVQLGIRKYFASGDSRKQLTVLSVTGLNEALALFVDKSDKSAFEDLVEHQMKETRKYIEIKDLEDPENIMEVIDDFRKEREGTGDLEEKQVRRFLNAKDRATQRRTEDPVALFTLDSEDEDQPNEEEITVNEKGRGRGRGRGRARARRARGSRGAAQSSRTATVTGNVSVNELTFVESTSARTAKKTAEKIPLQSTAQRATTSQLSKTREGTRRVYISDSDSD